MSELDAATVAALLEAAGLVGSAFDVEETTSDLNSRIAASDSLQPLLDTDPTIDPFESERPWD